MKKRKRYWLLLTLAELEQLKTCLKSASLACRLDDHVMINTVNQLRLSIDTQVALQDSPAEDPARKWEKRGRPSRVNLGVG